MRERLHEYLRARPAGAAVAELIGLVFSGAGRDADFGPRFLQALLGHDPRFQFDGDAQVWHVRAAVAVPQILAESTFVVVDLETTGDAPIFGAITEIGAVRLERGRVTGEFQRLINPGRPIQPFVVGLTGITDAMVAGAPRIRDVLPEFLEFAGDAVLVAHNAQFDVGHLDAVHQLVFGRPLDRPSVCTLKLARRLMPELTHRNLDAVSAALGLGGADRHRALGDARITADVLSIFLEKAAAEGVTTLAQLIELQRRAADGKPFVMQIPRDRLDEVPSRPGVYHFLGEDGRLLYVGRARKLRDRLGTYFTNARDHAHKTLEMIRQARDFRIFETGSELAASLLEARHIHDLKPPFNRQRRHLPRVGYLKLSLGNAFPRLWVTGKLTADRALYVGPFASLQNAERAHAVLVRRFGVRTCPETLEPSPSFTPCHSGQIGECTAPCAERVDRGAYRAQIDDLVAFLAGNDAVPARLRAERDACAARDDFEAAQRLHRDLDVLDDLQRRQRTLHWILARQNFAVLLPTADRDAAQFYGVLGGRLAVESRVTAAGDLVAAAGLVRERFPRYQDAPLGREDVESATILAAWLRDRGQEGLFLPLDTADAIFDRLDELTVTVSDLRQRGPLPFIDGLHE